MKEAVLKGDSIYVTFSKEQNSKKNKIKTRKTENIKPTL